MEWARSRWAEALPQFEDRFMSLPDRLDRDSVRRACQEAGSDTFRATEAFAVVMAWGFGQVGYGPHRTARILATPDAPTRLHEVVLSLSVDGALAGYRTLASHSRLHGLGPAFGTKYLYFCQPRPTSQVALILDALVASWLTREAQVHADPVPWSVSTYAKYLDLMHIWGEELRCSADEIEMCIFRSMATERGSAWGDDSFVALRAIER